MAGKKTIIAKLREQVDKDGLAEDIAVAYKVQGGAGEQHLIESVVLSSDGKLKVQIDDKLHDRQDESLKDSDKDDTINTIRMLLEGVDSMVPAAKARFIPDTLIGSVTFSYGGDSETYYFEADEEDCEHRGKPVPPKLVNIMNEMRKLESRYLEP